LYENSKFSDTIEMIGLKTKAYDTINQMIRPFHGR